MMASGQEADLVSRDSVDQAMFAVDAAGPAPPEFAS